LGVVESFSCPGRAARAQLAMADVEPAEEPEAPVSVFGKGMRGLLLRYMLYDALVRPDDHAYAAVRNTTSSTAWNAAVAALGTEGGRLAVMGAGAGELPYLAIMAAQWLQQGGLGSEVVLYEPIRPLAAAARACAKHNEISLRVVRAWVLAAPSSWAARRGGGL
jgi:hypothetical protein